MAGRLQRRQTTALVGIGGTVATDNPIVAQLALEMIQDSCDEAIRHIREIHREDDTSVEERMDMLSAIKAELKIAERRLLPDAF